MQGNAEKESVDGSSKAIPRFLNPDSRFLIDPDSKSVVYLRRESGHYEITVEEMVSFPVLVVGNPAEGSRIARAGDTLPVG